MAGSRGGLIAAGLLLAGCTSHVVGTSSPPTSHTATESAGFAACPAQSDGDVPTPGQFVRLSRPIGVVHSRVGVDLVVKPPSGDDSGRAWRLAVTTGSADLCLVMTSRTGNLVATSIAEIRTLQAGSVTLEATRRDGRTARMNVVIS